MVKSRHSGLGSAGLMLLGATVGVAGCGPLLGEEPEPEPEWVTSNAGESGYADVAPEARIAELEGTWVSDLALSALSTATPQVAVSLVAGAPPSSVEIRGDEYRFDAQVEAYVWTDDGELDTAIGGTLTFQRDWIDSGGMTATVPTSDLAGELRALVSDGGFPLVLDITLDPYSPPCVTGLTLTQPGSPSPTIGSATAFVSVE